MAGLEGTTLGPYKILSLLGAGGMGQVYRARDPRLDREVAIKVLSAALAQEEGYLERFRREARAVAQLNHPNIVPVYDYGEQNGTTYLVMPLIQGGTLRDLLTRRGALPLGEALPIIEQIAAALHYAHERGLVHRDVKPANILVGPDGRALLSDFGIVRVLSNDLASTMTQTGAFIGSPEYAAPEMVLAQGIDHRVDIYALGMVVFQMLIGRVAFAGPTPVSLLMMHAQQPPPSPRSLNPAIPPAVDAAILKALAKAPANRYQSVAEFAAALRVGAGMAQTQVGTNQMPNVSDMATLRSALPPTVPVAPPPALTPVVPPAPTPQLWSATPAYTPPALPTFTTGLPASYDQTIPRTGVYSAPSSVAPVPPPPPRRRRRVALLVTLALVLIVAGGSTLAVGIAQGWFSSNKTASSPTATTSPTATATTAPTATATPLPTYFYMAHNFAVMNSDLQNGDTADKQLNIGQGQYTQREGPKGDLYQFGEALFYGSQSSWATLVRDSNGKVAFVVLSDRFDTYQNAHRYFVRDLMLLPNPTTISLEEEAAGGMVVGPGSKQGYQLFVRDRNIVLTIAAVPAENAQDFSAYFLSVAMAVQARGHQCHYYAPDPTQPGTLKPVQGSPQACN